MRNDVGGGYTRNGNMYRYRRRGRRDGRRGRIKGTYSSRRWVDRSILYPVNKRVSRRETFVTMSGRLRWRIPRRLERNKGEVRKEGPDTIMESYGEEIGGSEEWSEKRWTFV